ncbi:hypothetical protein FC17_GL001090 [Secundilactobacillus paracollinoides DSM 15502 = JCM 11969]|nr:hypothetical protein FC17_GL001090 [Secundilactobacillus paracollinoides DSM 15502 = JCM 11969]
MRSIAVDDFISSRGRIPYKLGLTPLQCLTSSKSKLIVSGMEQFGTELWCRHQLATVLWSVTDVRDD